MGVGHRHTRHELRNRKMEHGHAMPTLRFRAKHGLFSYLGMAARALYAGLGVPSGLRMLNFDPSHQAPTSTEKSRFQMNITPM